MEKGLIRMAAITESDIRQLNALTLAYMGDAVYEQAVREHLIRSGRVKPNTLHKLATNYVSAVAQASAVRAMEADGFLSEGELAVVRRGRNAKSGHSPKSTDIQTYNYSSAFEALVGWLYLLGRTERLGEVIGRAISHAEAEREDGR